MNILTTPPTPGCLCCIAVSMRTQYYCDHSTGMLEQSGGSAQVGGNILPLLLPDITSNITVLGAILNQFAWVPFPRSPSKRKACR